MGAKVDDLVVCHPSQKTSRMDSILCGLSQEGTGVTVSHSKLGAVLPVSHAVTGGLGLPTMGTTAARGEGRRIVQTAAGSRGVIIIRSAAGDPATAVSQMATSKKPCVEIKRRVPWDRSVKVDGPVLRHPGLKMSQITGIPRSQSRAKTALI